MTCWRSCELFLCRDILWVCSMSEISSPKTVIMWIVFVYESQGGVKYSYQNIYTKISIPKPLNMSFRWWSTGIVFVFMPYYIFWQNCWGHQCFDKLFIIFSKFVSNSCDYKYETIYLTLQRFQANKGLNSFLIVPMDGERRSNNFCTYMYP